MTEKETEDLLILETRKVPTWRGVPLTVTAFKIVWDSYEYVLAETGYPPEKLIDMIEYDANFGGHEFSEFFPEAIGWLHCSFKEIWKDFDSP